MPQQAEAVLKPAEGGMCGRVITRVSDTRQSAGVALGLVFHRLTESASPRPGSILTTPSCLFKAAQRSGV